MEQKGPNWGVPVDHPPSGDKYLNEEGIFHTRLHRQVYQVNYCLVVIQGSFLLALSLREEINFVHRSLLMWQQTSLNYNQNAEFNLAAKELSSR